MASTDMEATRAGPASDARHGHQGDHGTTDDRLHNSSNSICARQRTSNMTLDDSSSKRRLSNIDPAFRPGAYSKAPGQEMRRISTLEYVSAYDQQYHQPPTEDFQEGNKDKERVVSAGVATGGPMTLDHEGTTSLDDDGRTLNHTSSELADSNGASQQPADRRLSRTSLEMRKTALAVTGLAPTLSTDGLSFEQHEKSTPASRPVECENGGTFTGIDDDSNRPKQMSCNSQRQTSASPPPEPKEPPSRLSRTSLELRKTAVALSVGLSQSGPFDDDSAAMTVTTKSVDQQALKGRTQQQQQQKEVAERIPSSFSLAAQVSKAPNATTERILQEHIPTETCTSLQVAAEVVKSPEVVEAEMRERISQEIANSCSLVQAVPAEEEDAASKQKCRTILVVAVVLVVLIIVGGMVAGVALTGTDGPEDGPSMAGSHSDDTDESTLFATLSDNDTIATVPATICYERAPLMGWSKVCPPQPTGSAVSDLVAASRLWSVPEANISILNAGELQTDMVEGNFTLAMTKALMPYHSDTLVTLKMEGAQIVTDLERGIQKLFDDLELLESVNRTFKAGSYPYAAGMRYDVNMTESFPRRLSNIHVYTGPFPPTPIIGDDDDASLWVPLQMQGVRYTVLTNSYLANGGDGYHEFNSAEKTDTELNALEEFVSYCQANEKLLEPLPSQRSTQSYIHNPNIKYCSCDTGVYTL